MRIKKKKIFLVNLETLDLDGAYDLIRELSRAATLYRRDVNPDDDFISQAWKTQIDVRREDGTPFSEVELICDPIYQKSFREVLIFLRYNFEFFQDQKLTPHENLQLAEAYSEIGSFAQAGYFFDCVPHETDFTPEEALTYLRVCKKLKITFAEDKLFQELLRKALSTDPSLTDCLDLVFLLQLNEKLFSLSESQELFARIEGALSCDLEVRTNFRVLVALADLELLLRAEKAEQREFLRGVRYQLELLRAQRDLAVRDPLREKLVSVLRESLRSETALEELEFQGLPRGLRPEVIRTTLDQSTGKILRQGYYFLGAQLTHLDAQLSVRLQSIQKLYGVDSFLISMSNFVDSDAVNLSLKNKDVLLDTIGVILQPSRLRLASEVQKLQKVVAAAEIQGLSLRNLLALQKITSELRGIQGLASSLSVALPSLAQHQIGQLKLQLFQLSKQFALLEPEFAAALSRSFAE